MIDGLVFLRMDGSKNILEVIDDEDNYDTADNFDAYVAGDAAEEIAGGVIRSYYFGDADDGAMKTGKQTVEIDGEKYSFKFKTSSSTKGSGIVGEDDHKLYNAGTVSYTHLDVYKRQPLPVLLFPEYPNQLMFLDILSSLSASFPAYQQFCPVFGFRQRLF